MSTKLPQVVRFLRKKSLDELIKKYKVIAKEHPEYPNLVLLKYHQLDSPTFHPLVDECRGIILDKDNEWLPVNFPFTRFYNYGQVHDLDWKSAQIFEKVDGSLACVWRYNKEWHMSTKGSPDASGSVGSKHITFTSLFWNTWNELGYCLPQNFDLCYFFELCTPLNRIVVNHKENRLVFLGARDRKYFYEKWPEQVIAEQNLNWECIKRYGFNDINEILKYCDTINPMEQEIC